MCQVHTCACVSLLAPGKTDYTTCHPRKTTTYILLHVVSITTHTHDRRKSIGKKKQRKGYRKGKKREESESVKEKKKRKRKEKKRQEKQEKTRQKEEARQTKDKNNVILADPRN